MPIGIWTSKPLLSMYDAIGGYYDRMSAMGHTAKMSCEE